MAYEFKKLSDVAVVETPTDTANVLIEEDGVIKKAPKSAVGGAGGIEVASVAEVGQTIVVKAVDENGKPTEWECIDAPVFIVRLDLDDYGSGLYLNNCDFDELRQMLNMNQSTILYYYGRYYCLTEWSNNVATYSRVCLDDGVLFYFEAFEIDFTQNIINDRIAMSTMRRRSSTPGSSKVFEITVDDSGTITATEVTD